MRLAPFAEERQDYRIARVVEVLMNVHRDTKKKRTPFTIYEIMNDLRFGDMPEQLPPAPTRRQSTAEQWAIIKQMAEAMGKPKNKK